MLVLSRRELQTVVFPQLGITIVITGIIGKTIRLGVTAPPEIRILRGELELNQCMNEDCATEEAQPGNLDTQKFQRCLYEAGLAIRLAQNQLRQRLNGHAEKALENAMERLEQLELAVQSSSDDLFPSAAVH